MTPAQKAAHQRLLKKLPSRVNQAKEEDEPLWTIPVFRKVKPRTHYWPDKHRRLSAEEKLYIGKAEDESFA